jgi:hypothetical protein
MNKTPPIQRKRQIDIMRKAIQPQTFSNFFYYYKHSILVHIGDMHHG